MKDGHVFVGNNAGPQRLTDMHCGRTNSLFRLLHGHPTLHADNYGSVPLVGASDPDPSFNGHDLNEGAGRAATIRISCAGHRIIRLAITVPLAGIALKLVPQVRDLELCFVKCR